jgi:hypothetical protein
MDTETTMVGLVQTGKAPFSLQQCPSGQKFDHFHYGGHIFR